jgi:hypothetical protein
MGRMVIEFPEIKVFFIRTIVICQFRTQAYVLYYTAKRFT